MKIRRPMTLRHPIPTCVEILKNNTTWISGWLRHTFAHVRTLLNLLYRITLQHTIENIYLIFHPADVPTQIEILKSPLADKFALQNDCRVHFREFLPGWGHRTDVPTQVKILKSPLATQFAQKSGLLRISTWVGTEQMCRLSLKFWKVRSTVIFKGLGFRD